MHGETALARSGQRANFFALRAILSLASKYPPAEPGAIVMGPLEAAVGVADAAPNLFAT